VKPILFSTPMVKAILEGRKTQTRRIIKPQPRKLFEGPFGGIAGYRDGDFEFSTKDSSTKIVSCKKNGPDNYAKDMAKYQPGDILWVREMFYAYGHWTSIYDSATGKTEWTFKDLTIVNKFHYKYFDNPPEVVLKRRPGGLGWYKRPSLFMPYEAARIFLQVTNVRVERLQDITVYDAVAEGVEFWNVDPVAFEGGELVADYKNYTWKDDPAYEYYWFPTFANPIDSFITLWQSINGNWNENPWVFVYDFVKQEISTS
jgi:hypothetical protein